MNASMTATERLVQRFVDRELSPEEQLRFLVRLGRDHALRERAIELESLVLDASRLPRPVVPEDFAAGVLERIGEPASSLWQRAIDALWTPRAMRWNLAGAMVTAALLFVVAGWLGAQLFRGERSVTRAENGSGPIQSAHPVLVRLVVVQPAARTVEAAGDFNGWNPTRTPLEPTSNGAWTVTIPLEPGRYEYMFVVDGKQWIADPFAVEQSDDGFGARNAVLDVRPPSSGVL